MFFNSPKRFVLLFSLLIVTSVVQARNLVIEPSSATELKAKQSTTLVVYGAIGTRIVWKAEKGQIEGSGSRVTYIAPDQAGTDVVTVFDRKSNTGTVKITVLPEEQRAAILIHANSQGNGYQQQQTLDFLAAYAYNTLKASDYDDNEILFLSYKPDLDINADAQPDKVVDVPVGLTAFLNGVQARDLTLTDIRSAFDWAKAKGQLSHPLIIIFIGHGSSDQLWLDSSGNEVITTTQFKDLLDAYQDKTGNQTVVIFDASYTGTFVSDLKAKAKIICISLNGKKVCTKLRSSIPERVIISSTNDNFAYYKNLGRSSFLKLYLDQLRLGENFWQAWQTVKETLSGSMPPFDQQIPQLYDSSKFDKLAKQLCLNQCLDDLPDEPTLTVKLKVLRLAGIIGTALNPIKVQKLSPIVPLGKPISLDVLTDISSDSIQKVFGSLLTPTMTFNEFGHPFQPMPIILFQPVNTRKKQDKEVHWSGQISEHELTTSGTYTLTVNAIDDKGFSTEKVKTFCVKSCKSDTTPVENLSKMNSVASFCGYSCEGNTNFQNITDNMSVIQEAQLTNISTRAPILGGANNVIAGFIIEGTGTQPIVLRGWGLETGVDPKLILQKQINNSWEKVDDNNSWQRGARYQEIPSQMTNSFEADDAALLLDLTEGVYMLNLSSVGQTGRGLVGVDAIGSNQNIKLINISTRAPIKGGADNVVAGFIIDGTGTQKIVLRGWGLDAGVNPKIVLQKRSSSNQWQEVATNNDWRTDSRHAEIPAYMTANFESNDAALLRDLQAGVYTVTLSSVGATGLGLIGVDALD
jgi:hypothetical protein